MHTPTAPQSIEMRVLAARVEQRRSLVGDRTRITSRIRDTLKQYYPEVLDWLEHIDTVLFCDFL